MMPRAPRVATLTSTKSNRWFVLPGLSGASIGMKAACVAWVLAYILPGILGHEPWKQDETYTFGIINHFLRTDAWLLPINAGQPFLEKPPWFMWTASAFAWSMRAFLPLHDGARLASAFYTALTLGFVARAAAGVASRIDSAVPSYEVGSTNAGQRFAVPATVALFAGTMLVVKHTHDLFSDVSLLAGTAIAFAALCRIAQTCALDDARRKGVALAAIWMSNDAAHSSMPATKTASHAPLPFGEAILFGIGVGIAFLSKGVFVPGLFLLTALAVPICYRSCRSVRYWTAFGIALFSSAPFLLIWPALLYRASPDLFLVWFWDNNVGRFLGFSVAHLGSGNEPGLIWKAMLGVCFPVGPLALAGLVFGGWGRLRIPTLGIATLFAGMGVVALAQSATVRQLYLLPFTVPAALLAFDALQRLVTYEPSGRLSAWAARIVSPLTGIGWDWACRMLFGALALLVWFIWAVRTWGHDEARPGETPLDPDARTAFSRPLQQGIAATQQLGRWLPLDFPLHSHWIAIGAALGLSIGWLSLMCYLRRTGPWRGVMSWCAGITLVWGLINTLLLPWIDRAKSYGPVYENLAFKWAHDWRADDCVAGVHLGESEAPMLEYFTGRTAQPVANASALATSGCRWVIVQSPGGLPTPIDARAASASSASWQHYWDGARQGDTRERLTVYRDAARER